MKPPKPARWSRCVDLHPNGFLQTDYLLAHRNTRMRSFVGSKLGLTAEKANVANFDGRRPHTLKHPPSTERSISAQQVADSKWGKS